MQAVKQNDMRRVKDFLLRNKFLVYDFDHAFLTALHWVAKRGFFGMVRLLIKNGADSDAKDIIGRSPLFLAASFQHTEIVQVDFIINIFSIFCITRRILGQHTPWIIYLSQKITQKFITT